MVIKCIAAMHDAAVVPHDHVVDLPLLVPRQIRTILAVSPQFIQKRFRLIHRQIVNIGIGVPAEEQRLTPGFGMGATPVGVISSCAVAIVMLLCTDNRLTMIDRDCNAAWHGMLERVEGKAKFDPLRKSNWVNGAHWKSSHASSRRLCRWLRASGMAIALMVTHDQSHLLKGKRYEP